MIVVLIAAMLSVGGCVTVGFRIGDRFDPAALEQALQPGTSTQADVRRVFGDPYGRGRAMMPYHESPRTIWTYYFEEGTLSSGGGENRDERRYLFVFFSGDRYDGYMWFNSKMQ